jgi:hypothetical protein
MILKRKRGGAVGRYVGARRRTAVRVHQYLDRQRAADLRLREFGSVQRLMRSRLLGNLSAGLEDVVPLFLIPAWRRFKGKPLESTALVACDAGCLADANDATARGTIIDTMVTGRKMTTLVFLRVGSR